MILKYDIDKHNIIFYIIYYRIFHSIDKHNIIFYDIDKHNNIFYDIKILY